MEHEALELLNRLVQAAERIADSLEREGSEEDEPGFAGQSLSDVQ